MNQAMSTDFIFELKRDLSQTCSITFEQPLIKAVVMLKAFYCKLQYHVQQYLHNVTLIERVCE